MSRTKSGAMLPFVAVSVLLWAVLLSTMIGSRLIPLLEQIEIHCGRSRMERGTSVVRHI
jgi:hypothetical protein